MIYLVDASVYIFRAYYSALPERLDRDGNPSNATFGFARFLCDLIERVRPRYIAVAFDHSLTSSFRNRIYPPYKANREPAPPGLALQFERCFELCAALGIKAIGSAEYEADDIIGTLVTLMRGADVPATLVTRDKDLAQLIREGDILWDFAAGQRLGYADVASRFGAAPERFADYLALSGDAVDNIPGVPGIGAKTAAALMREFASLEEIYAGLDRVGSLPVRGSAAVRTRLIQHRDAAFLARQLTAIACDAPLGVTGEDLRRSAPDLTALTGFFDRQGFGPLLRQQAQRLAALPLS